VYNNERDLSYHHSDIAYGYYGENNRRARSRSAEITRQAEPDGEFGGRIQPDGLRVRRSLQKVGKLGNQSDTKRNRTNLVRG
jgi:hypothetical protein